MQQQIKKILIVGGGSAGWMVAALFSRLFKRLYEITLVESDEIGTIGVGEATIPAIKRFNELLGLDEDDFLRRTQGSFKLGIEFRNWHRQGDSYIHGFGPIGQDLGWLRCHHYWLHQQAQGKAPDFDGLAINTAAARAGKFMRARPDLPDSPLSHIAHAFHFDAGLYARYLREMAEKAGVQRLEGRIGAVHLRPEDGFVQSVTLADGREVAADFFIDCSGFRGLIIEQALKTGYEDWRHWLPCDRALAVPCARQPGEMTPYTSATAHGAGWQWRIPLRHRTGNGHVYASPFMEEAEAEHILLSNLDGPALADPLRIQFTTGKRRQLWNRNCVAVGLASGFLEPLESTSLHLIQSAAIRLVRLMPDGRFDPAVIAEFNRQSDFEYERIRDFIILHYKATARDDTPFWRYCRDMAIPETLQRKIDLFAACGRIFREDEELFAEESWIQVFLGQGIIPRSPDPLVRVQDDAEIAEYLSNITGVIGKCVAVMPGHAAYLERICGVG
ncbi:MULTISPECIES: tryptophan halogenase family protein [unclassified Azospirillum]|uniref:tryptophan halogenase family protein n=1 Tax=unclassified Azospirillum TaxID=2630922 RepID=UPI001FCDDC01|nr:MULTISPECIES: tryptophan halogenase family protein [unclassified Azospirillum]